MSNRKKLFFIKDSLREKCPNTEFFWSLFSRIRTEYGEIRSISPYSVRIRENEDQKKTPYSETFHAVNVRTHLEQKMIH